MYSRDYDTPGCQPDMFFQAAQARLFVELKIGAQAAPDQLHRYAALAAWLGRHDREQPWAIVFMGPSEKRFESIRRAAELGANGDISSKVLARCAAMKVSRADLESALQRMELATTSYVAFDHRLVAELDALFDYSPSEAGLREGDEALSKLIRGMRAFLQDVIM